jgi:hypothetical protein
MQQNMRPESAIFQPEAPPLLKPPPTQAAVVGSVCRLNNGLGFLPSPIQRVSFLFKSENRIDFPPRHMTLTECSGHRGRYPERLVNADEIVIHGVKRNRGGVIRDFP